LKDAKENGWEVWGKTTTVDQMMMLSMMIFVLLVCHFKPQYINQYKKEKRTSIGIRISKERECEYVRSHNSEDEKEKNKRERERRQMEIKHACSLRL
jgi:hypothetical protein